jgi:dGTP triphosphohydrolase
VDSDSYYQPPEDAWDVYEQKREQIVNDIWDMPLVAFAAEMAPFNTSGDGLGAAIDRAVDELAQRTLEEYVEGMADYQADREYQRRKEMDD